MRPTLALLLLFGSCVAAQAHDFGTAVTWNRQISRIVYDRCASCHRNGGTAFSLMSYQEAQPHAVAIKEAVLNRRMPPWGAVKGFGDFRDDQSLTQEQIEIVTDWVEGGLQRGNNPNALPKEPKFKNPSDSFKGPKNGLSVSGELTLNRRIRLDGLLPEKVPEGASMQIVAEFPDGHTEPLLWLYEYRNAYRHPFFFRKTLDLPAGTVIRGVPSAASIALISK